VQEVEVPPVRTIIDEPVHTPGATIVVDSVGGGIPVDVPCHNIVHAGMSEMIHHFLFINITTITVIHGINQHNFYTNKTIDFSFYHLDSCYV
jgi:hypothetical protein